MNFLKKHDIVLKIVALLVAIFLWSYVVVITNPSKVVKFPGIAVQMTGVEQLEERGLMLVTETDPKIDINVTGTTKDVVNLNVADIKAVVDFSDIQEASTYYMQPTVTVPTAESVTFKPQRLQFKVENIVTKSVPVKVTTMNDLAGDRLIDKLTPSQQKVTVRGAESVVATVDYALVTVDLQDISKNMAQTCRVSLYAEDNTLIDSPYVSAENPSVDVTIGLNHVVTVPLNVTLISSAELSRDMVGVTINPESVRVYGAKSDVDSLTSLSLGSIDLGQVEDDGQQFTLSIKLPTGVKLMEGEPTTARVTLTMEENVTRTINVTNIELNDTNSADQPPEVNLNTGSLSVEIQGKAHLVAGITAADIHAQATFDSASLGEGSHAVPVTVTVNQSGVTVLSTDLTAMILIEAQEEENNQS